MDYKQIVCCCWELQQGLHRIWFSSGYKGLPQFLALWALRYLFGLCLKGSINIGTTCTWNLWCWCNPPSRNIPNLFSMDLMRKPSHLSDKFCLPAWKWLFVLFIHSCLSSAKSFTNVCLQELRTSHQVLSFLPILRQARCQLTCFDKN